jgi:hypothetical protein
VLGDQLRKEDSVPTSYYETWRAGGLTNEQALYALCSDRGELKSELTLLEAQLKMIEAEISEVVTAMGGRAHVTGTGTLIIRAPAVAHSYDPGRLNELVQSLRETGRSDIADEIAACKKAQARAGGLVITPERRKRPMP